jgi:hypothetical protein
MRVQDVYTISEYCEIEKISRSKLYKEWQEGGGVEFYRRGNRILITEEARLRHREKLEREAFDVREKRCARHSAAHTNAEAA